QGGAARVLKCFTEGSTREQDVVAIKEIDHSNQNVFKHFLREIKLLRAIKHDYVPRYLDHFYIVDVDGDKRHFLVEEFIEGPTLSDFVRHRIKGRESYDLPMILVIAISIMGFIEFMNRNDLVHRDVSPRNIIVKKGFIDSLYFVDWGTAISLR